MQYLLHCDNVAIYLSLREGLWGSFVGDSSPTAEESK